jgi:rhodanese-related sulfurtransferase
MGIFDAIFGSGVDTAKVKEMLQEGAKVIDVRTPSEFSSGHVKGSKNIPLQNIHLKVDEIRKMGKPVVLCCATGNRSGQAAHMLKEQGIECINGGGWKKVRDLTQKAA